MLREQVPLDLRVVDGNAGFGKHPPDERRVFDFLRNFPIGEKCLPFVPRRDSSRRVLGCTDRRQPRTNAGLDEFVGPGEIHQRVTPVEEDGLEHAARVCVPWRDDSSGPRSRSLRSR